MRGFVSIFLCFLSLSIFAQRNLTRQEYIDIYKELAMQEMVKTGIPASITLAQGILESGNGNSSLAKKANNHFGIKCHDWQGPSVKHDDDAKNECFRKYKSVEASYHDHSEFLTTRGRYATLFELEPNDYKGWAKGLKEAGYATSPTYAKALIKLIEDNKLHELDAYVLSNKHEKWKKNAVAQVEYAGGRKIQYNNRVKYVVAREGDSYQLLAEELDLLDWQLPKYNESSIKKELTEGEMVYLQPKRRKADIKHKTHLVADGETIASIAQQYAMQATHLRKRNLLPENAEPNVGEILLLRKRKKGSLNPAKVMDHLDTSDEEPASSFEVQTEVE